LRKSDEQFKDQFKCAIAWLEKQGEQKSVNKVEPKFKVGNWVVIEVGELSKTLLITKVEKDKYLYWFNDDSYLPFTEEQCLRLWAIQDAKDGDVLSWDDSKCIAIFKNIYDEDSFNSYGFVGGCTGTFESRQSYHDIEGAHPASKEQRNQLEKAMADAGYTFDFEKKELKKIEQKPAEWHREDEQNLNACLGYIQDEFLRRWLTDIIHVKYDKLAWSEEDEEIHRKCICAMRASACGFPEEEKFVEQVDNWLKDLKNRVQPQPQHEWSKEDEELLQDISDTYFYNDEDYPEETYKQMLKRVLDWMTKRAKSLRPQSTWKPSEGQMVVLNDIIINGHLSNANERILKGLQEQLKKL